MISPLNPTVKPSPEQAESSSGSAQLARTRLRLARLRALRSSVEHQARELELAYAGLIEAMAQVSGRLVEVAEPDLEPISSRPIGLAGLADRRLSQAAVRPARGPDE